MHSLRTAAALLVIALLASCAPRRAPPEPAPPPPAPPPPEPAPPPPLAWQDAPLSAGDWSFRSDGGSSAVYGTGGAPLFVISCDASRRISLTRAGGAGGALVVRTSFGDRALNATAQAGGLVASLAAGDPLLDQMVFSRGRFAVQADGQPLLVLPAWPEPARVIEDCRG